MSDSKLRRPSLSKLTAEALEEGAAQLRVDMASAEPARARQLLRAVEYIEAVLEHRRRASVRSE